MMVMFSFPPNLITYPSLWGLWLCVWIWWVKCVCFICLCVCLIKHSKLGLCVFMKDKHVHDRSISRFSRFSSINRFSSISSISSISRFSSISRSAASAESAESAASADIITIKSLLELNWIAFHFSRLVFSTKFVLNEIFVEQNSRKWTN